MTAIEMPTIAAATLAGLACVSDIRTRRIPNYLTLGGAVVALVYFLVTAGFRGLAFSFGGWALGLAVFLPFFLVGGMGAGDVKLVSALGAWVGPWNVIWVALYGGVAGGILAILLALGHGYLRTALSNLGYILWFWRTTGPRPVPGFTLREATGPRLAYAVPIAIGMVATLWLR